MFTPDLQALIFKTRLQAGAGRDGVGKRKAFFGKESAALRLLMHLNPEQKMKSLWADAKQYNDFPLILGSSWTACPAWNKNHILHFALTLHPFYTPTNAVSHQNSPRLTKEKQSSLLLLFVTFITAQGLCYCCWHWTSCLQSQWAHFSSDCGFEHNFLYMAFSDPLRVLLGKKNV